jgi:hypothetical protein
MASQAIKGNLWLHEKRLEKTDDFHHEFRLPIHKFTTTAMDGRDMTPELTEFIDFVGLECLIPGRYSLLLVLHLFAGQNTRHSNQNHARDCGARKRR